MSDKNEQDLERRMQETMAAVWKKYLPLNRERIDVIENAVRCIGTAKFTREVRREAESEAHKLAGAGGTMSHLRVSDLARRIEEMLRPEVDISDAQKKELSDLAAELRREFEATAR